MYDWGLCVCACVVTLYFPLCERGRASNEPNIYIFPVGAYVSCLCVKREAERAGGHDRGESTVCVVRSAVCAAVRMSYKIYIHMYEGAVSRSCVYGGVFQCKHST